MMASDEQAALLRDPDALAEQARDLLEGPATSGEEPAPLEEAIRGAHELLTPFLEALDEHKDDKDKLPCAELFGSPAPDKVASLILLVRQTLLDLTQCPGEWLEIEQGRHDLTLYVRTLNELDATAGLGIIYELASAREQRQSTPFWQGVAQYYLVQLARAREARSYVLAFLREHEQARRQLEQLMTASDQAVAGLARSLGEDYLRARQAGALAGLSAEAPPYVQRYIEIEKETAGAQAPGLAALLSAERRIRRAVEAQDSAALGAWISRGSPAAARAAFLACQAGHSAGDYASLLIQMLATEGMPPARLAAIVLELGRINQSSNPNGGEPRLNSALLELALSDDPGRTGPARVAVRQLRDVDAFNEVLQVVDESPSIEVAAEGVRALFDLRRLPLAEQVVRRRSALLPVYRQAEKEFLALRSLLESAFSAPSPDVAQMYLDRLRDLGAEPELRQICQKNNPISELARQTLSDLRLARSGQKKR